MSDFLSGVMNFNPKLRAEKLLTNHDGSDII